MRARSGILVLLAFGAVFAGGSTGCGDCEVKIETNELPNGIVGGEYRFNLDSDCGGDFWFTDDSLPPGISIQSDGDLLGTPVAAGTFFFTITVVDFSDNEEASKGFQLIIEPSNPPRTPTATPAP